MERYKRITKNSARAYFKAGASIYLLPSNVNEQVFYTENAMIRPVMIRMFHDAGEFDQKVNAFEYYNCNNEVGKRAHYYIKQKEETE